MSYSVDHVELFVPSRREAAEWYQLVLGLAVVAEAEEWAENPNGPLMISGDSGRTKIALFRGDPSVHGAGGGFYQLSFRAEGNEFLAFCEKSVKLGLKDRHGGSARIADHGLAFSIYFVDPWGHCLELTTYDH